MYTTEQEINTILDKQLQANGIWRTAVSFERGPGLTKLTMIRKPGQNIVVAANCVDPAESVFQPVLSVTIYL